MRRSFQCRRRHAARADVLQYSTALVALSGAVAVPIGLFFMFARLRFLPEDERFAGASLRAIEEVAPRMSPWLAHVFQVLGGFVIATGILTVHVAMTTFRRRERGSTPSLVAAGVSSFGTLAIVNVLLRSDFRKQLVGLSCVWAVGVLLHLRGR